MHYESFWKRKKDKVRINNKNVQQIEAIAPTTPNIQII